MTLMFLIGAYLIPAVIAFARPHPQKFAIAAVNLFGGWTILGWIAALAWALTSTTPRMTIVYQQPGPLPGWYADPAGSGRLRLWDGARWTGNYR